jgi:hypothetical protein
LNTWVRSSVTARLLQAVGKAAVLERHRRPCRDQAHGPRLLEGEARAPACAIEREITEHVLVVAQRNEQSRTAVDAGTPVALDDP